MQTKFSNSSESHEKFKLSEANFDKAAVTVSASGDEVSLVTFGDITLETQQGLSCSKDKRPTAPAELDSLEERAARARTIREWRGSLTCRLKDAYNPI